MINNELHTRRYIVGGLFVLIILIYILRLFQLQIFTSSYKESAEGNAFLKRTIFPPRGLIYDRNGKLLVYNKPTYDILVTMQDAVSFDTLDFCNTLSMTKEDFVKKMEDIKNKKKNIGYSPYSPQVFTTQLQADDYARFMEKLYMFPGFSVQKRTLREYAYKTAAHAFGTLGEVSGDDIKADSYYKLGDYVGKTGLEKSYETDLRGEKGVEIFLRDSRGRIEGSYNHGQDDKDPVPGRNLNLGLDIDLQLLGEQLMTGKRGSIVAIEPSTGEILAIVSAPSYDPALMAGRQRSALFQQINSDPQKPLLDRSIMARYPPGSTFKAVNALVLQQTGNITKDTYYGCNRGYVVGNFRVACHSHPSPLNLIGAIANSCNAYFCAGLRAMLDNPKYQNITEAFNLWRNEIMTFGYGNKLGVDLPHENGGNIPTTDVYDKIHGKGKWKSLNVVSIAIGQGEVLATSLQIANAAACIANRGFWITPHLVKNVEGEPIPEQYKQHHVTTVDKKYFDVVVTGMAHAVTDETGTARVAKIEGIEVCGKTGTAQDPPRKDHSIFMGFAPKDNPKIAIMCIVENSGFGATYAAPVCSLMMEYYLKRSISPEREGTKNTLINTHLIPANATKN